MENYEIKFEQIANEIKLASPITILDINCVSGEFYQYLTEYSNLFLKNVKYVGIDESDLNIIAAKEKFSNTNCSFACGKWTDHLSSDIDLVVFNGAFSRKTSEFRNSAITKILSTARYGFIGNFTTYNSLTDKRNNDVTLVNPSDVLRLIDYSEFRVKLIANYIPNDFTISARRWEPEIK